MSEYRSYRVWDAPTRAFHWINLACVVALAAIGLVILNAGSIGVPNAGKILLKTWHVYVGYVFALNLAFRLLWAFVGNHHARWRQMLPGGSGYWTRLRAYAAGFTRSTPDAGTYVGHNPAGRIAVAVLLLLIINQAVTGLVLAGTDIFFPPFGGWIAATIAAPGVDPSTLLPYSPDTYDAAAFASMRAWRSTFATLHVYGFYALIVAIVVHVTAVVVTESRKGGTLVSAMLTGRKLIAGRVLDTAVATRDPRP